ncbi:hypothetical protein ACFWGI_32945 [Streptomyces niveus]
MLTEAIATRYVAPSREGGSLPGIVGPTISGRTAHHVECVAILEPIAKSS